MLNELINSLTRAQKGELLSKGVDPSLISMWKTGRRRPTYEQCIALSEVTKYSLEKLLVEVALKDAEMKKMKKLKDNN